MICKIGNFETVQMLSNTSMKKYIMYLYPTDYSAVLKHHILEEHFMGEKISQCMLKKSLQNSTILIPFLNYLKCQLAV